MTREFESRPHRMKNNQLSISGALVFKDSRGKRFFLLVKDEEERKWEIPKVNVRRGESSVRASIRMTGEQAGINARVLDEVGRANGALVLNGRTVHVKYYYYLMVFRASGEILGFKDYEWFKYDAAVKKLTLKREISSLKKAREYLKKWQRKPEDDEII